MNVEGFTNLSPADRAELSRILSAGVPFIDHPDFHLPDAERRIITDAAPLPEPDTAWLTRDLFTRSIGEIAATPARPRFMTKDQTRSAFLQFNFARMSAARCRAAILAGDDSRKTARALLHWHRMAMGVRNLIIGHHLPLVVRLAERWDIAGHDRDDLLSEGFHSLAKVVAIFDVSRADGSLLGLIKPNVVGAFQHLLKHGYRYRKMYSAPFKPSLAGRTDPTAERREEDRRELLELVRSIIDDNTASLTGDEMIALKARYWQQGTRRGNNVMRLCPLYRIQKLLKADTPRVVRLLRSAMQKLRAAVRWAMEGRTIAVAERLRNHITGQAMSA